MGDWQMPCLVNAQGPESKQIWQMRPRHGESTELSSRCGDRAVSSLLCNPLCDFRPCGWGPPSEAAWPGVFCPYLTDSVVCAFRPAGDRWKAVWFCGLRACVDNWHPENNDLNPCLWQQAVERHFLVLYLWMKETFCVSSQALQFLDERSFPLTFLSVLFAYRLEGTDKTWTIVLSEPLCKNTFKHLFCMASRTGFWAVRLKSLYEGPEMETCEPYSSMNIISKANMSIQKYRPEQQRAVNTSYPLCYTSPSLLSSLSCTTAIFSLWPFWFLTRSRDLLPRFKFLKARIKAHTCCEAWVCKHSAAVVVRVFWNELGHWFWNKFPCIKAKPTCMWLLAVFGELVLFFYLLTHSKKQGYVFFHLFYPDW